MTFSEFRECLEDVIVDEDRFCLEYAPSAAAAKEMFSNGRAFEAMGSVYAQIGHRLLKSE